MNEEKKSVRERMPWPLQERRTPRPPLSRRLALILAAVTMAFTSFVFLQADKALDRVDSESVDRQEDDARTLQLICERQDTGLRLSLESREFISKNDQVLLTLVNVSISPENIADSQAQRGPLTENQQKALGIFKQQAESLERQVKRIAATRSELRDQLDALDCETIPPPDAKDAEEIRKAKPGATPPGTH